MLKCYCISTVTQRIPHSLPGGKRAIAVTFELRALSLSIIKAVNIRRLEIRLASNSNSFVDMIINMAKKKDRNRSASKSSGSKDTSCVDPQYTPKESSAKDIHLTDAADAVEDEPDTS